LASLYLGSTGKELIEEFTGDRDFTLKESINGNIAEVFGRDLSINWNPRNTGDKIPNLGGTTGRKPYIGLGHEMGHLLSFKRLLDLSEVWPGTKKHTDIDGNYLFDVSEIYASHIENKIRAEHGAPLRSHYGIDTEDKPVPETKLVNANRNSLYYRSDGTTNFNKLLSGVIPYKY
jgi:hypothetical protein